MVAVAAAVTGHCTEAADLARLGAPLATTGDTPAFVKADADALSSYTAMGCAPPTTLPSLQVLASRLRESGATDAAALGREYRTLGKIVHNRFPLDSLWVARLAPTGDYLFGVEADFLAGHRTGASSKLQQLASNRTGAVSGDINADATLQEARVWLLLGDSTGARTALGESLDHARNFAPLEWADADLNVGLVAGFVRAMALRAQLLPAHSVRAHQWSSAVAVLWAGADPELQPTVRRMRELAH